MTMNALGGFAVALVFIASNLYIGGFAISDYGCKCGAIGAWVGASIAFVIGLMLTSLFIKAYKLYIPSSFLMFSTHLFVGQAHLLSDSL